MNIKIKKFIAKKNKSKIVSLTAYSKSISKILDKYCDMVLVGDSMANVLYGLKDTHKITLDNIIQHAYRRQNQFATLFIDDSKSKQAHRCWYGT